MKRLFEKLEMGFKKAYIDVLCLSRGTQDILKDKKGGITLLEILTIAAVILVLIFIMFMPFLEEIFQKAFTGLGNIVTDIFSRI